MMHIHNKYVYIIYVPRVLETGKPCIVKWNGVWEVVRSFIVFDNRYILGRITKEKLMMMDYKAEEFCKGLNNKTEVNE